jgi:hypothetical protein
VAIVQLVVLAIAIAIIMILAAIAIGAYGFKERSADCIADNAVAIAGQVAVDQGHQRQRLVQQCSTHYRNRMVCISRDIAIRAVHSAVYREDAAAIVSSHLPAIIRNRMQCTMHK